MNTFPHGLLTWQWFIAELELEANAGCV